MDQSDRHLNSSWRVVASDNELPGDDAGLKARPDFKFTSE